MSYINRFQLIKNIIEKKPIDSKQVLAKVDRHAVIRALKAKKHLPQPFQCSDEPKEDKNFEEMPHRYKDYLLKVCERIPKFPEEELPKLIALKERYPNVSCIYNYISGAHAYLDKDKQKHLETILETIEKFPDYLFGKIALAEYYLNQNSFREIPKIFDGKFDITQHYPEVEIFHNSEIRAFYGVVGRYFVQANHLARALFCYFILDDIVPDHLATRQLGDEIVLKEIENLHKVISKNAQRGRKNRKK